MCHASSLDNSAFLKVSDTEYQRTLHHNVKRVQVPMNFCCHSFLMSDIFCSQAKG